MSLDDDDDGDGFDLHAGDPEWDHYTRTWWGHPKHDEPYYVIVDGNWEVLGHGRTIDAAVTSAHENEQHELCRHCGRANEEADGWRAYPITPDAYGTLNDGYYDLKFTDPSESYRWATEWGAFVWLPYVSCVACKGTGNVRVPNARKRHCECCDSGIIEEYTGAYDEKPEWIAPPADACVWSEG